MAKKATKKPVSAAAKKSAGSAKGAKEKGTKPKVSAKAIEKPAKVVSKTLAKPSKVAKETPSTKKVGKVSAPVKPAKSEKVVKADKPVVAEKPVKTDKKPAKPEVVVEKVAPKVLSAAPKANVAKGESVATVVADEKPAKKKDALDSIKIDRENVKWADLKKKYGHLDARNYSMRETYEVNRPLVHKILGWGFIIQVLNDRLDVVFEQGIKQLISNYNPA